MSTEPFDYSIYEERLKNRLFRELPGLLQAYTWARDHQWTASDGSLVAGDIDTPDHPSVGMKSYLRIAMRHPGRVPRLIYELKTLIERGPDDEIVYELMDIGIMGSDRLRPSDGTHPEEFFSRMIPYLEAFVDAGERTDDRKPETRWEWNERFDELSHLFGGYYMYWQDDYADHDAVLSEQLGIPVIPETAQAALAQLSELRETCSGESQLERAVDTLGCYGYPPKGLTYDQWLDHIAEWIREHTPEGD